MRNSRITGNFFNSDLVKATASLTIAVRMIAGLKNTEHKIGLGHTRLSIMIISSCHQPMISSDESVVLVFNGEIYNFLDLRDELERGDISKVLILKCFKHVS